MKPHRGPLVHVPTKDRTAWLTYAVRVYDGTKVTKHYPDLVVVDGKKLIAVEVEHARKRARGSPPTPTSSTRSPRDRAP